MLQEYEGRQMDDDLEALKKGGLGSEMERWNVEDLKDYVARMTAEIARVEKIIASKDSVNTAAAALFSKGK